MSYPQQPHYPQPPQQWGPPVPPPPSKGTTIGAAVLALLSGLLSAVALVAFFGFVGRYAGTVFRDPLFIVSISLQAVNLLLLLVGAFMLFARVGAGRFLVIAGTVLKLGLLGWSIATVGTLGLLNPLGLLILLLAIVASVLAIVPSTGRWIAAKKQQPQHGFPPPGYQQPGYQQPGYGPPQQW